MLILSLLIIPLIGVLLMLPLEAGTIVTYPKPDFSSPIKLVDENYVQETENVEANTLMKNLALFVSLLNLFISIYMWFQFDNSSTSYQFVYEFNNLNFCHFHVGVDGISLFFILLTTFITPICILSN